jgi:hypothetical protein
MTVSSDQARIKAALAEYVQAAETARVELEADLREDDADVGHALSNFDWIVKRELHCLEAAIDG